MGIKFDEHPLAVEKSNYTTKVVNAYIANDLDTWSKNSTDNFKLKNWLLAQLIK